MSLCIDVLVGFRDGAQRVTNRSSARRLERKMRENMQEHWPHMAVLSRIDITRYEEIYAAREC